MFNTNSRVLRVLAIFMALTLAVGAVSAAAPTIDDETTNTETTSDVTDDTTIESFAADDSTYSWIEASDMTEDGELRVIDPDSDETMYTNSSAQATDETNGHYAFNVSHDEWSDLPIQSGENKTFTVQLVNDTSVNNPDTTNLSVHFDGVPGRTVVYADESTLGDNFDVLSTGFQIETLGWNILGGEDTTQTDAEDLAINGSDSNVTIHYGNDTAIDSLDTGISDLSAADWSPSTIVSLSTGDDSEPVKAYVDEPADDRNESASYAVIDTSSNDVTIHTGEEFEGEDELDVSMQTNAGWFDRFGAYNIRLLGFEWPDIL